MEIVEQVPKTALDVFRLLPEGTLCEVIDNVLYMSPAPKYNHQKLTFLLARTIGGYFDKVDIGEVMISPFDVFFDNLQSAVQPDVLVVLNENREILKEDGYIHGAPDIIIEVLSGDIKRDTVTKKELYEKAGVKEYFIANPANRNIKCFTLHNGKYTLTADTTGKFSSALLGLEFEF